MPQSILDWGMNLILDLQAALDLAGPMNAITFLGSEEFFLIFFPFLYWAVENRLRLQVAIFFTASVIVNSSLKIALHQPRPFWLDTNIQLLAESDGLFGLPSGHSQHTLVIWGAVAAYFRRGWIWIAVGLLVLLVGISRIYLGVHFPTDVLVGWLIGGLLLLGLLAGQDRAVAWFKRHSWQQQIGWVGLFALAGILIGVLVSGVTQATWSLPDEWAVTAVQQAPEIELLPFTFTDFITICATIFGFLSGYIWLENRGGFNAGGPVLKRIGRYLLGAIVVVFIWAALDSIFAAIADDETILGYILRAIRYSLVGLWVGALGPLLFQKLQLAD